MTLSPAPPGAARRGGTPGSTIAIDAELLRRALALPHAHPWHALLGEEMHRVRRAGTMLPIVLGEEPHVLATVRAETLRDHAGEVAFPGGKIDPGDPTPLDAALRELEEELGVPRAQCEPLGALSEIPTMTGKFLIHPFVGLVAADAPVRPAASEVARVLRVPIVPWLTGDARRAEVTMPWQGSTIGVPHFDVDGAILYGASAYTFFELLVKIAAVLDIELPAAIATNTAPWMKHLGERG